VASTGVRELKAHLSQYVQRAAMGETVIVTDHGKPVAVLAPLPRGMWVLHELRKLGRVRWAGGKPAVTPVRPGEADVDVAGAIGAARGGAQPR